MRIRLLSPALLITAFAVCAFAIDSPNDEATNRKTLALTDPVELERLRNNLAAFKSMPKEQQDRVRKLDADLNDHDSLERNRLRGIMERYAGWVSRLTDAERAELEATAPGPERLKKVQELLDRHWQESLSKADKERLSKATPEEKVKILDQLRRDDEERRRIRATARRIAEANAAQGTGTGFTAFLEDSVRPLLSDADEKRLNSLMNRNGWPRFLELFQDHAKAIDPLPFPGPAPPGKRKAVRSWSDLPADLKQKFPTPMPKEITSAEGKWPDFPLVIAKFAKDQHIEISTRLLGPTRIDELPVSARRFVDMTLTPNLTREEYEQLYATEGTWPDFPKKVKELADQHLLQVPGLTRPQAREMPANKNKAKGPPA